MLLYHMNTVLAPVMVVLLYHVNVVLASVVVMLLHRVNVVLAPVIVVVVVNPVFLSSPLLPVPGKLRGLVSVSNSALLLMFVYKHNKMGS